MVNYFNNLNSSLHELLNFAPMIKSEVRNTLLSCCGLEPSAEGWLELEQRCFSLSSKIKNELLTPFINTVLNGIQDSHNSVPVISCVDKRAFESWTDADIDRFPGLVEGIGNLFQYHWQNIGSIKPDLSGNERKQFEEIHNFFDTQIQMLKKKTSVSTLRQVLREILECLVKTQVENNGENDG